jgi:hypothetical protein
VRAGSSSTVWSSNMVFPLRIVVPGCGVRQKD